MHPDRLNRRRYDFYAPFYDRMVRMFAPARRLALDSLALQPGERLAIIGCGTGLDLDFLPPGVSIAGLDVSPGMLSRARRRALQLGLAVDWIEGDARQLPWADATFDAVVLHLILAVAPEPERVAREAARVLRPGGRASVFDKFLPAGQRPGVFRRMANAVIGLLFSDINRQIEPLMAAAGLRIESDIPAGFGSFYRRLRVVKPAANRGPTT
jgi:ubiquinone/menaquinone biosynthesis C-methylase UbiE